MRANLGSSGWVAGVGDSGSGGCSGEVAARGCVVEKGEGGVVEATDYYLVAEGAQHTTLERFETLDRAC